MTPQWVNGQPLPKVVVVDPDSGAASSPQLDTLVMRSGVAQVNGGVAGGASAGWLSGTIASLAANGAATVVFDLGPKWARYGLLQIAVRASAALSSINEDASDDGSTKIQPLVATTGSALAMTLTAAGDAVATALPSGRYVIVSITNGAAAQGAGSFVRVTAHPA